MLIVILLCVFCLSGCVINRVSIYKIRGDKLGFPIGGMIPISGEDIEGILVHWFFWTNDKDRPVPPMPEIIIRDKGVGKNTDDEIIIKQNFTQKD